MSGHDKALKGLLALSGSVLAMSASAAPVAAQEADYEVVVTAQKREQNIQDVPLAVTALSGNQLENAGVVDIRALQTLSASVNLNSTQTESGGTTMRIRGVGTTGNNAGLESAVGVFIDGVYVSRPSIALGELLDVQQVEILRGPQGTLFGRNTSAGAVTITTRSPDLEAFGGFGNMTFGALEGGDVAGLISAQVGVNIPVIPEQLGLRIAAAGRLRDGLLTSTAADNEQNTRDRWMLRAQALWEPTPDISLRLIADHQEGNDECCDAVVLRETGFLAAYTSVFGAGNEGAPASGWSALENRRSNSQQFRDPGEQTGVTAQFDWDIGFGALTYIGGYRDSEAGPNVQESDFVNLNVFSVPGGSGPNNNFGSTQYASHELRLAGEAGRLDWMVGYYYGREDIDTRGRLTLGPNFQGNTNANLYALLSAFTPAFMVGQLAPAMTGGVAAAAAFLANPSGAITGGVNPSGAYADNLFTQEGESQSFFTHNTLALTDRFEITVGARYVEEEKIGRFDQLAASNNACGAALLNASPAVPGNLYNQFGAVANPQLRGALQAAVLPVTVGFTCFPFATPANFPGAGTPAGPPTPAEFSNRFEDDELVYTLAANYALTDDVHAYVSATHGFKSGGFNLDPTAALRGADPRFNSELVDAYELGLKTELLDNRLRTNVALFRSELEDFQVLEFTGIQFVTFNVPSVLAQGAEIEMQGQVTEDLGLSLAVTYTDAAYPSDCAPASAALPVRSLCGAPLTNAPEWVSILGLDYSRNLGSSLRWFVSGSARYESERRTSTQAYVVSSSVPLQSILNPDDIQDANTKVNLRMGLGGQDDSWALELWGTNIFNEQTRNVTFNIPLRGINQYQARGAFLEEPAIYGLTLRSNF